MTQAAERHQPLWLTEEDVGASIDLNTAINALEQGIKLEAQGAATNVDKALATWSPGGSMHSLGSLMPERGFAGFKTWAFTPSGAAATFSLFDTTNGRLLALIEAGLVGLLRTSGISGLATQALADPDADEMALIGAGRQAMMQVAAIAATRRLKRLKIWSRTPENRSAFAAKMRSLFPFVIEESTTVEEALADTPIVTLITRSTEPFVDGAMLARGAHVNAAGAILPANAEFLPNVLERASMVVVDNIGNARKASRELRDQYGTGDDGWSDVTTLGQVLAVGAGRPADADITLFKPMGMGLSDLSVAILVYQRAVELGLGMALPARNVPMPRWTLA